MKVKDIIKVPALKPRDPNQRVLASKKNAGGAMRDKAKEMERGKFKHRAQMYEDLDEAKDKKPKAPEVPKMHAPGLEITMQEGWRDRLTKAVKKLGYPIAASGYADGSTSWRVFIDIDRKFNKTEFTNKLRDELGADWMDIRFYDLSKLEEE